MVCTVPTGSYISGQLTYSYEVSDGTDFQAFGGIGGFNAVNKAGTLTMQYTTVGTATQAPLAESKGSSTLTHAISLADGTAGALQFKATDTTSLTATTNRIRYNLRILAPAAVVCAAQ